MTIILNTSYHFVSVMYSSFHPSIIQQPQYLRLPPERPTVTPAEEQQFKDTYEARNPEVDPFEVVPEKTDPTKNARKRKYHAANRIVCINSADRNKDLWPSVTDFEISLGESFTDVYSIKLVDLQFASSVNIVTPDNDTISWINLEDTDIGYPIYTAILRNGSYNGNATSLVNEMTSKMNGVKRRNGAGSLHYFIINIDTDTDVVSFTSLNNQALPSAAFATIANSNMITVSLTRHGYQAFDTIFFSNVLSLPGISSDYLNNQSFLIQSIPDDDTFTIEVNAVANATASGGGSSASVGSPADFKLLWGSSTNTCADILGFADEDSNVVNPIFNPLRTMTLPIEDVEILGVQQTRIVSSNHTLSIGDTVRVTNLNTRPSTYGADSLGTITTVLQVDTPDSFICDLGIGSVDTSNLSVAFIGTSIVTLNYINHNFNQVISITGAGSSTAQMTTVMPHQLMPGVVVFMGGTNTIPNIIGSFVVVSAPTAYIFTITLPQELMTNGTRGIIGDTGQNIIKSALLASNNSNIITITTAQVHGIIPGQTVYISFPEAIPDPIADIYVVENVASSHTFQIVLRTNIVFPGRNGSGSVITFAESFILYNVTSTLGFPSSTINGVRFSIRDILSPSFLTFSVYGNYAGLPGPTGTGVTFGGNDVAISSAFHGFAGTQSNVDSSNAIIRNVNLSGPDFLYLTCPGLPMNDIVDATGRVQSILAKIFLSGPVGTVLFQQFTDTPKYFTNGLITIDRLRLQLLDSRGQVVTTNNMDFSFSVQVISISYEDIGNNMNSRNYLRVANAEEAVKEARASGRVE